MLKGSLEMYLTLTSIGFNGVVELLDIPRRTINDWLMGYTFTMNPEYLEQVETFLLEERKRINKLKGFDLKVTVSEREAEYKKRRAKGENVSDEGLLLRMMREALQKHARITGFPVSQIAKAMNLNIHSTQQLLDETMPPMKIRYTTFRKLEMYLRDNEVHDLSFDV